MALLILMVAGLAGLFAPAPAQAAPFCSVGVSATNFGDTVSPLSQTVVDGVATLTFSCSGVTPYVPLTLCPNLDAGSGGSLPGGTRLLTGPGGQTLQYQIYQNSARTQPWGSAMLLAFGAVPTITGTPNAAGAFTVTTTLYSRMWLSSASSVGTYSSAFAGQTFFVGINLLSCAGVTIGATVPVPTIDFRATLTADCQIAAGGLNFGSVGVITAPVVGQSSITVTCAKGAPYSVQLDDGEAPSGVGARRMRKGAEYIVYGLFQDSGHATAWSSASPGLGAVGTGGVQTLTVYGRAPAQSTPSPGIYADKVVAQITY